MYFSNFQYTEFEGSIVRDIIRSVSLIYDVQDSSDLFDTYEMMDGEKIENISYRLYGSTEYHWVLLFINDIKNPWNDLPQKESVIRDACIDRFGSPDGIHHYESSIRKGEWVNSFDINAFPVTNIEYLMNENDKKRKIKTLKPQFLSDFVNLYMEQIK